MKPFMRNARVLLMASVAVPALLIGAAQAATVQHIILLSVDGLHEADLTDAATAVYMPNIIALEQNGITYTNARSSSPSDSFPGTLALVTGATTKSTGVFYDDSYARNLYAPGTTLAQITSGAVTPGTEVPFAENVDKNLTLLSGGGATSGAGAYGKSAIDVTQLPVDANGNPVQPWQFNKTNTIFDIAKAAGLTSAFMDKHPGAYTIVQGPTGNAVTDFYSPEINATTAIIGGKLVDASTAPAGTPTGNGDNQLGTTTSNYRKVQAWDNLKQTALLNELNGKNALGDTAQATPAIIYSNFQGVSVAQKLGTNSTGTGGITIDPITGNEVVSAALASAFTNVDAIVKSLVDTLKANGQYASTQIILTAKHGQDPRIGAGHLIAASSLSNDLTAAGFNLGQVTQDDVALIWLTDQTQAAALTAFLQNYALTHPEIKAILNGANFGSPSTDNRTPDVVVQLNPGYIYAGNIANTRKRAEHGGVYNIDDTGVPLIVSGGLANYAQGTTINDLVYSTQVAPTILTNLGLDPNGLTGVQMENTQALPVAEPMSIAMLLAGLGGLALVRRKRD